MPTERNCFAVSARTQPIIVNATLEMLNDHILPVAEKLKDNARVMEKMEEEYLSELRRQRQTMAKGEEEETNIVQEVGREL